MGNPETETGWAERFDQDVQTLLHSGDVPHASQTDLPQDYRETLAIALALRSTPVAHLSRARHSLRQKLLTRSENQREVGSNTTHQGVQTMHSGFSKFSLARQSAFALAVLVVLLSLSLTIQPVRALASQFLGQMGLFNFTNDPAIPTEWIGQENFNSAAAATPMPVENLGGLSAEEAARQAGFALYTPGYLPECFAFNDRILTRGQGSAVVTSAYHCPGQSVYDLAFLQIEQSQFQAETKTDFAIGDAQPVELDVRGQAGLWIDQAPIGVQSNREGKTELMRVNLLVWEEGGFFFQMRSNTLPREEMLKVAESLQ